MIKFVSRLNLKGSRVDRDNGIIKGVSLISLGEAKGHDKLCDRKTLESVRDCAQTYGDGLRVRFNPNTFAHGPAMLAGRIPADSIHIKGDKTLGDLHLYKSIPEQTREYLYEIAEETPGNIGLSIEFTGGDEEIKGEKFARCSEIYAATIVDLPAANPTGLFAIGEGKEELTTNKGGSNNDETEFDNMNDETIQKLSAGIATAMKPVFKQCLEEAMPATPTKSKEDQEKEEMAAAGVIAEDDDATKKQKLESYRTSMAAFGNKKVSELSAKEFSTLVGQANMQFFRSVGGKPAKTSADVEHGKGEDDEFEKLVDAQMASGAKDRGTAINRVRQDNPAAYNAFHAKRHPNAQQMSAKKK